MAGYANRVIKKSFPELAEDGDYIEVIIRNPKTVPLPRLMPPEAEALVGEDGAGVASASTVQKLGAMDGVLAGLVIGWHVYDATSDDEDDQPLLPLPATADSVAKLPSVIKSWMVDEVGKAMSPKQTASPAAGTSSTSSPSPNPSTTEPGPDPSLSRPS